MSAGDTIYALSSGGLPSGVAIIRLSGAAVTNVAQELCGGVPEPRMASLRTIRNRNGDILDQGLVLFFPGPNSFTGEHCLELQVHGGKAVVEAVLSALSTFPMLRHAEAGEFSRRAFLNGKMDLLEIEGLADLIAAETEMQRRLASEHARGELSALYQGWARRLTHARAMIEAELDFADEDDVPGSVSGTIWRDMEALEREMAYHLANARTGAIIRDGYTVVIAGPPNAGKSSLLNALARDDVAIVSEVEGTTRDVISVDISLPGFAVRLIDTAGLRETVDSIEREGIRRAEQRIAEADLILSLSEDPTGFVPLVDVRGKVLRVGTKVDRTGDLWHGADVDIVISAVEKNGLDPLIMAIASYLPQLISGQSLSIPSRRRQEDQLKKAYNALTLAREEEAPDLQAEHLRIAATALGRITGSVDVEDLLDIIFSEFCIGK